MNTRERNKRVYYMSKPSKKHNKYREILKIFNFIHYVSTYIYIKKNYYNFYIEKTKNFDNTE